MVEKLCFKSPEKLRKNSAFLDLREKKLHAAIIIQISEFSVWFATPFAVLKDVTNF